MSTEREEKLQRLVEQYIGLFNDPAATLADLKKFFDPGIVWREMPNRFAPAGQTSDYEGILASWVRGRELLPRQEYTLRRVIVGADDTAALEFGWRGTLAQPLAGLPAGSELSGHVASFLHFRDGRIVAQTDYPCYDPLPVGTD